MRWAWPFKARSGNGRNDGENCSSTGDAPPDFLCVGAQKGATSWLYYQLASHPDFWMPPIKELHYFDQLSRIQRQATPRPRDRRDLCFLEGIGSLSGQPHIDLENYARLFEPKGSLLSGDIERVVSYFPNLKVIFLARDPVERAWSQLSMEVRLRMINPFDVTDIDAVHRNLLRPGVLPRSHPTTAVARWKRHVHPDLFRIYFFDDLERNPTELRRTILHFLEADANKRRGRLPANYNADAAKKKLRLTDKVRACMAKFFEQELKACAAQLGGPAMKWPARYGFSVFCFVWQLADYFGLFPWCDWVA